VLELESSQHVFLASMAAYVGLKPQTDIRWLTMSDAEAMHRLAEGKIDAYLRFPPPPQELRARKAGRVIVNSAIDRPWSQYFCCIAAGNREFVRVALRFIASYMALPTAVASCTSSNLPDRTS
jgi:NitT/TauT family transport system substrate-binding protein